MQDSGKVATCRGRHLPIHSHNNMAEQHFDRLEDNSMTYVSYCCTDVAELNLPPIVFVPLRTNQIYQQSYGKPKIMVLSPWVVEAYKLSTAALSNLGQGVVGLLQRKRQSEFKLLVITFCGLTDLPFRSQSLLQAWNRAHSRVIHRKERLHSTD